MANDGETLLLFGGVPEGYTAEWDITSDTERMADVLDVQVVEVSVDVLMAAEEALDEGERGEAESLARELLNGATGPGSGTVGMAEMEEAARLYLAMRRFVQKHDADAVTITCWPWIRGEGEPTPCVALVLFQEEGLPAACQGDMDALLTMVLIKRATGLPSFMGGALKANGGLGISHCVMCRQMLGPESPVQPYEVYDYHGRKPGPTLRTELPQGTTVTVARLTQNLERLLLTTGTVRRMGDYQDYCRNTLVLDVPDRERVLNAVKGIQNHYVVVAGDHAAKLAAMAHERGIAVERLD
jgi:L-fucose isomerase-like protein